MLHKTKLMSKKNKTKEEDFVNEHFPMIQAIAKSVVASSKLPPGLSYDDLLSLGVEGLYKSREKFDAGRGVDFKIFASYRVRGEMLDRIRTEWRYRNPSSLHTQNMQRKVGELALAAQEENPGSDQAAKLKSILANTAMAYLLSSEDVQLPSEMEGSQDPSVEVIDNIEFEHERKILWEEVKSLPEDESKLLKLFYLENQSLSDIAETLGYSKSKVSRLHLQVLHKLRLRLNRKL